MGLFATHHEQEIYDLNNKHKMKMMSLRYVWRSRINELHEAIKKALNIKNLWVPSNKVVEEEHSGEVTAILNMLEEFERVDKPPLLPIIEEGFEEKFYLCLDWIKSNGHKDSCSVHDEHNNITCNCGYHELLEKLDNA